MQKTVLIIILMLLTLNVRAANDSISTTRENLGSFLNDSVKTLKESFFERDEELISQKENAKNLKREAEELRDNSKEAESNPRILKQGKSEIPKCDYTKQDLEWKNSKGWVCRNTEYDSDCQKVEGENKIEIGEGSGNYKCQYPDNYRYVYKKWGVCQDSIGEKHDQYACIFKVDKTGQEYQVDDLAKCGDMPQRYETPCGKYGAKSTCRCEGGASYYYKASEKKGYCASDFICEPGFSVSGGKCVTTLGQKH